MRGGVALRVDPGRQFGELCAELVGEAGLARVGLRIGAFPRRILDGLDLRMHRVESRLDAVDAQIKAVEDAAWKRTDPEADARKSSFADQLSAQLAELSARIDAESDSARKAELEAEKATKEQWLNAIK